jgi:predicted metalloprotease
MIAVVVVAMAALVITGLTASPADVAFENDDFQVPPPDTSPPPIPIPQTEQEVVQWAQANPIYDQSMPAPVRCNAQPIDVQNASATVLKAHFDGLMECLVRAWQPPVTNAGFIITRPTITIYGESITTRCGESGINAFDCSADQQLYDSTELPRQIRALRGKWAADVVMAHEYGHLLQGRTGLFAAGIIASKNAGSDEAGLIYRRRLETQADCFSATFIRSVSTSLNIQQADVEDILNSYAVVGDDAASGDPTVVGDHGLSRSRRYWGNVGLGTSAIGACNTFTADDSLVR